jgi:hypothetical protein
MADQPPKSSTVKLDGDHVVQMLKSAGLDPHKLDVRRALPGANVDYQELESRLRGTHAPAAAKPSGGWHVSVSVSRD